RKEKTGIDPRSSCLLKDNIRDYDTQGKSLDTDLFVRVLSLSVQEGHNVRVTSVKVHSTSALSRSQLVSVGESILQLLHNRDNSGSDTIGILDTSTFFTKVGKKKCNTPSSLRQLKRVSDASTDRFHVILDTKKEAGN